MPTNLYGEGDNFDPLNSHNTGLIARLYEAKKNKKKNLNLGNRKSKKRFLICYDLTDFCLNYLNLKIPGMI